jgi:hypothetical protein
MRVSDEGCCCCSGDLWQKSAGARRAMREGKGREGKGRPTSEAWVEKKEKERQDNTIITPCTCKLSYQM